jgi:putative hydrolase of the HAD superfamily
VTRLTVYLDADDTLWHNLVHFDTAEKRFGEMFSTYMPATDATRAIMETEKRNIALYGFGVKSFTLAMIETAIAVSGGAVDAVTIQKLIGMGRDMLDHDIELLPHVEKTMAALHGRHKLLLVTKGDLHHQERKVLASGLAHFFEGVEIVSDKTPATYHAICKRHGVAVERCVMVGNSIRSDVLPMIEAGGHGVYVPFNIIWDHEHEDVPPDTERFHEIAHLGELPELLARLQSR